MDAALTIITDIIIIITFPLHCRYLYVMLRKDVKLFYLEYAFRVSLINIVAANIIYSFVFILIREPASYGLLSDFYRSQSWWLGKIAIMQSVPITLITLIFHVIIALNRLSAVTFPLGYARLWTDKRVRRVIITIWVLTLLGCIPLAYPIEGGFYNFPSPFNSTGVALRVTGDVPNLIYQSIAMGVGGLLEIVVMFIYAFIGIRVSRLKNLPKSTVTPTISAVLVSTGGFVIVLVYLPHVLAIRITGKPIWSYEIFNGLFKFAFAYNNAVAPWVMLFYYRNIRRLIGGKNLERTIDKKATMDTVLTIIADIIIVATFPLHCRYLYVMLRKDADHSSLEYAFRATLTNLVVANLLYSFVFILIREPASDGLFSDFYRIRRLIVAKRQDTSISARSTITILEAKKSPNL